MARVRATLDREQLHKQERRGLPLRSAVALKAEGEGEKKRRTFRMVAYTGATFSRFWTGSLTIDLAGISPFSERGLPMLINHDSDRPAGVAEKGSVEDGEGLVLEGRLLSGEHGKYIASMADEDGYPWTASVGIRCLAETELKEGAELEVNGRTIKGPAFVWTKSELYETSFVTAGPADAGTSVEVMTLMGDKNALPAATPPAPDLARIKLEVMESERNRRKAIMGAFPHDKKFARDAFERGLELNKAHEEYGQYMAAQAAEAQDKVRHEAGRKTSLVSPAEALRIQREIGRGHDPKEKARAARRAERSADRAERFVKSGNLAAALGSRHLNDADMTRLPELMRAYQAWSQPNMEGLRNRSIFSKNAGGYRLLQAVDQGLEYGRLRAMAAKDGIQMDTPYSVSEDDFQRLVSTLLGCDARAPGGEGRAERLARAWGFDEQGQMVERLGGTWGKNAHSYASVVTKGFLAALFKPLEDDVGDSWAQRVGITVPSNQEQEVYRFLGNLPMPRVWRGNRVTGFMPEFQLTISNDTWEITLDFSINDFRFDKSGQIMLRLGEMGLRAKQNWEVQATQVLLNNPTTYDALALFNAAHTDGGGFTYSNIFTKTNVPQLSVANPSNPTPSDCVNALMGCIAATYNFPDQNGAPFNGGARKFCAIVPPNLWAPMLTATRADRLNLVQIDNALKLQQYDIEIIPNGWLTTPFIGNSANTAVFYIARLDTLFRGIVLQDVTGWQAQVLADGSDTTVLRDKVLYGMRAVRGAGPGHPAHIAQATFST